MEKIKCPFCSSTNTEYVDLVENDINCKCGYSLESHCCNKCDEWFARPYNMFISKVDKVKYPDVEQEYRLELIEE